MNQQDISEKFEKSKLFTRWTNPSSGIVSYLLTERVAPVQQSFYFTNTSFSSDGRWLWFYCAFPPATGQFLGVADLENDTVDWFPETQFREVSPLIDTETSEAYWASGTQIWKRGPRKEEKPVPVGTFPDTFIAGRSIRQLVCHLTFSADKKALNFDAFLGEDSYIGEMPLDGSGIRIWQHIKGQRYNHGQFSPTDANLQLVAQDHWRHPVTGEFFREIKNRMWLIRRGEAAKPVFEDNLVACNYSHEWWDAKGEYVWYVHIKEGTGRIHIRTFKNEMIWPGATGHSHCDRDGKYLTGDIGTYNWDNGCRDGICRVAFLNTVTGNSVDIVSDIPEGPYDRKKYHTDPHPQFCLKDSLICYTTTVLGYFTPALVPVKALVQATASC